VAGLDAELPAFLPLLLLLLLLLFPEPDEEAAGFPSLVTVNCDKRKCESISPTQFRRQLT
jgi:hypothetical protein